MQAIQFFMFFEAAAFIAAALHYIVEGTELMSKPGRKSWTRGYPQVKKSTKMS